MPSLTERFEIMVAVIIPSLTERIEIMVAVTLVKNLGPPLPKWSDVSRKTKSRRQHALFLYADKLML